MNDKSCASFNGIKRWEDIDFRAAKAHVENLQTRIGNAYKEGKYNKVKALQYLLSRSFYAKALAIKRVTRKRKTKPGVDGIRWLTPKDKWQALLELNHKGYIPQPVKRVFIPKRNRGKRPIGIPTMKDRAMQTLHKYTLEPIAEITADPNSYAYIKGRCTQDALGKCVEVLLNSKSQYVLEGDIKGCFDNLSHEWIINHIPMVKSFLRKFLKSGFEYKGQAFPTKKGIAQGANISPVICNMVLDGLENYLQTKFRSDGKPYFAEFHFIRYADDFIVVSEDKEFLIHSLLPAIAFFLKERGLNLSTEKTIITHINDGFNFLGWNIKKTEKGKLRIAPTEENIEAIIRSMWKAIKYNNPFVPLELKLKVLKLMTQGWVNHHENAIRKIKPHAATLDKAVREIERILKQHIKDYINGLN